MEALLIERTKDSYLKYEKAKLCEAYKNEKIANKIVEVIPKGLTLLSRGIPTKGVPTQIIDALKHENIQ